MATKYKQRNDKAVHACIPRSKVRRSMETHIQTQADGKQTYTRMYRVCIPRSKCHTSNGDVCKLKQTKNKTSRFSCACIPHSKRQTSNGDAYSNASRRKTNLHVHVYLVLSVRRAFRRVMWTLVGLNRRKTKRHMHINLVLSVRRAMETLTCKQTGKNTTRACIPRENIKKQKVVKCQKSSLKSQTFRA